MPLPETYRAFVLDQQRTLARLVRIQGVAPIRRLYESMLEGVTRQLGRRAADGFGAIQLRGMLAQIRLGLAALQRPVTGALNEAAFTAAISQARGTLEGLARLERAMSGAVVPLPLLETARLNGLVRGQTSSLLAAHGRSVARYGASLVRRMERTLGASLAAGESQTQAIDRIAEVGDAEWWQGERIVRTELAHSASSTTREVIEEQSEELGGDLWMRWTEHVDDDGTPRDDRVEVDSLAMHGQVAPPGGMFVMPPSAPDGREVPKGLAGKEWACPPNRPNDRACLTPWRPHWTEVPGWVWRGRRVPATERLVAQMLRSAA